MERRPSLREAADWRRAPLPPAEPAAAGATRRARVLRLEPCRLFTACAERATAVAMVAHSLRANVVAGAPGAGAAGMGAGRPKKWAEKRGPCMRPPPEDSQDWAPPPAGAPAGCRALLALLPPFPCNLAFLTSKLADRNRLPLPLQLAATAHGRLQARRRAGGRWVHLGSMRNAGVWTARAWRLAAAAAALPPLPPPPPRLAPSATGAAAAASVHGRPSPHRRGAHIQ